MRRTSTAVTKLAGMDAEARVLEFVCSTSDEDRSGDTIRQAGWKLDNYMRNPLLLWMHDRSLPPIGRAVRMNKSDPRGLVGSFQYATAEMNPLAETVFQLAANGFINSGSVGFLPIKYSFNDNNGIDFEEQELLEFSNTTVPCNPNALGQMRSLGIDLAPMAKALGAAPDDFRTVLAAVERAEQQNAARAAALRNAYRITAQENAVRLA